MARTVCHLTVNWFYLPPSSPMVTSVELLQPDAFAMNYHSTRKTSCVIAQDHLIIYLCVTLLERCDAR